ncbi:MAG TPA: hypothetical protein PK747_08430 [Acidobacteriota bacterium]|mgnify:CR=1 FL=1|nr:hypothetical protein [Acidobacteriota bacterium]HQQ47419.1 hypothetical protein [Acidobacteriota bacterium]
MSYKVFRVEVAKWNATMNKQLLILIIALLIAGFSMGLFAQDWDRYKDNTVKEIISTAAKDYVLKDDYTIDALPVPFRAKVEYLGKHRVPSPEKMKVVNMWLIAHSQDPNFAGIYNNEVLVKEGGKKYWVLVQDSLFKEMEEILRKGDSFWIYAQLWGAAKKKFVVLVFSWEEM